MMKLNVLLMMMFICFLNPNKTVADVHLRGQLKNMGSRDVVMRYNGAASMLGDSRDIILLTDVEGRFDTILPLNKPEYYSISRNTLYLTPGDDLEMVITQSNNEAEFKGVGAEVNTYMKGRLFPKGGSFLEAGRNVRADFAKTKKTVDSLANVRLAELEALTTATNEFKALESARITGDVVNSYISYSSYGLSGSLPEGSPKEKYGELMEKHMKSIAKPLNKMYEKLVDEKLLDVAVVRDVLSYQEEDEYEWFKGIVFPKRTKELYAAGKEITKLRGEVTQELVDQINQFILMVENLDFATELKHKVAQAGRLLPGQPAIDFELVDVNGVKGRLSDLKGKFIYVDLWATWCGPCIEESPAFEALAEKYKGKDIVFIPVSTDNQKSAWYHFLSQHKKQLAQYNSQDLALRDGWCVMYIPRFILIDKEFNIVNAYAPLPSTDEATSLLNSLLK